MAQALVELVKRQFPHAVLATHAQCGDETVVLAAESWHPVHRFLRDSPVSLLNMLVDLTAVDYPNEVPRFEVVTHLVSLPLGHRLRLKTRVGDAEGDEARVASVADLWASANWLERECWDMMGVVFDGHPDLRRILLYPEFEGHPLRKDYPADRIQPLVPYRPVPNTEKLPPFGPDEGMSFPRKDYRSDEVADDGERVRA